MKQNMMRRLLALTAAGALALGLVACGGGSSAGSSASSEPAKEEAAEEAPAEETAEAEAPAEEAAPEAEAPAEAAPAEEAAAEEVDPASLTGTVVWYTADPEEIATEILDAFKEKYPNVKTELTRNGGGKLTAQLTAEMEAGGTPCNCFSFYDLNFLNNWDQKGLIKHYTPKNAEYLVDNTYGDLGFPYHLEICGIAYNTNLVKEGQIKDWSDLTDPSLKGMVAFADPSYSGAALGSAVTHAQNPDLTGWDFYEAMKANDLKFEQSNGNLATKVGTGEYAAVVLVDYMARNAAANGDPVGFVYPESGAHLVYHMFSLVSTVKPEDEAAVEAFADFLLSPECQAIEVANNYLPGVTNVAPLEGYDASKIKFMPFDPQYYIDNVDAVREKYNEIFPAN